MDIYELIDELENELSEGKNVLFSKKGVVDLKKCEKLISEIKQALPFTIQESKYTLSQKNKILSSAEEQAKKIIADAKEYAENMIQQSDISKLSEERAKLLMNKADDYSDNLEKITRKNIDKMLKSIEDYLMDNLHIVRNNREELAGSLLQSKKPKSDK